MVLMEEYSSSLFHPNIDKVTKEVISYLRIKGTSDVIFTAYQEGLLFYIKGEKEIIPFLNNINMYKIEPNNVNLTHLINTKNITAVIIDFPKQDLNVPESILIKNKCRLENKFYEKYTLIAKVYSCVAS